MAWRKYWKKGDDFFQSSKVDASAGNAKVKTEDAHKLNPETQTEFWKSGTESMNQDDFKPMMMPSTSFVLRTNLKTEKRSFTFLDSKPSKKARFGNLSDSDSSSSSSSGTCSSGSCSSCKREPIVMPLSPNSNVSSSGYDASGSEAECSDGTRQLVSEFRKAGISESSSLAPTTQESNRPSTLTMKSKFYRKSQKQQPAPELKLAKDGAVNTEFTLSSDGSSSKIQAVASKPTSSEEPENMDTESPADNSRTNLPVESAEAEADYFEIHTPCCRMSLKLKINKFRVFLEMMTALLKKMKPTQKISFNRKDLIQLAKKKTEYLFMDYSRIPSNWITILEKVYGITKKDFPGLDGTSMEVD